MTTFDPLSAAADSAGLEALRSGCPVARTPNGPWYLARYADVLAATQDVELFQASFRQPGVIVPDEEQLINEIPEPRHGQVRRIINSAIAVHRLVNIEPFCEDLCNALLDDLLARDEPIDLVTDYVMAVPNNVIAHLLGAPREDFPLWARWSDEVVQGTWPALNRNERGVGLPGAHPEFSDYVDALIKARRDVPRDDFITRLLEAEVDGRHLTDVEARTQLVFLFISGNETTRGISSATCCGPSRRTLTSTRGCGQTVTSCPLRWRSRCATIRRSASCCATACRNTICTANTSHPARRWRSGSSRPTATRTCSTTRTRSGSTVRILVATSRSVAARTCVRGRASLASKVGSRWACSSSASPRSAPSTPAPTTRCR